MKIGIITFPNAINYGTALQATALQKVLSDRSNDVYFVPHKNKEIDSSSKVFDLSKIFSIKYSLAHLYNMPEAIKRASEFKKFRNKYFVYGSEKTNAYDIIVTGSDQVWNYNLTACDMFYYLDFNKNNTKKVSYAASFGLSEIDDKHKSTVSKLIGDFDYLSVREQTGAKIIKDLNATDVPVVLDPTLLLDINEWQALCKPNEQNEKYIFVYTVFNSNNIWNYAQELSKKTGLPIKTVSYSKIHKQKAEYDLTASPDKWLSYIMNAEYVVTNSFHGVAFSINFRKNFFFDMPPEQSGVGSRISDITSRYFLSDRNISKSDFVPTLDAPDFTKTNSILEEDKTFSLNFIDSFLNNNKTEEF